MFLDPWKEDSTRHVLFWFLPMVVNLFSIWFVCSPLLYSAWYDTKCRMSIRSIKMSSLRMEERTTFRIDLYLSERLPVIRVAIGPESVLPDLQTEV